MTRLKALFYLLVSVSICYGLPTSKNSSVINKEIKMNSDQDIKTNATNVKPPQVNNSNLKVLNFTETKNTTQLEGKFKKNQNDKTKSETVFNSSDKDSQRTSLNFQNGSQNIVGLALKNAQDDEVKKVKLPDVNEKSNIEKDKVDGNTGSQEKEKEKPENQKTEKDSKENLKSDNSKLSDKINLENKNQASKNLSPVENVILEKQSTFKQTDKEVSKDEDTVKEIDKPENAAKETSKPAEAAKETIKNEVGVNDPLYNLDEREKIKEENYDDDEYDTPNSQVNVKNIPERENPSLNNPSGYIPNKNLGMIDDANSHFFAYLVTLMVLVVLFYLLFHNKQRIIALMIEGRGSRPSRRGSARAKYHKLDNNLEEAMGSMRSGGNANLNNIY